MVDFSKPVEFSFIMENIAVILILTAIFAFLVKLNSNSKN